MLEIYLYFVYFALYIFKNSYYVESQPLWALLYNKQARQVRSAGLMSFLSVLVSQTVLFSLSVTVLSITNYQIHFYFVFFGSTTLSRCQISSTYSWIVLSEVNLPLHATLRIALLAQPFSSL